MKRSGMVVTVVGLGVGLFALLGVQGCAADDTTGDSGDGRDELNADGSLEQANGDAAGEFGPLEKKPFGASIDLSARKLMIADEVKKAFGSSELQFANGGGKAEIDPSSFVAIDELGFHGELQYAKAKTSGVRRLALFEAKASVKASARLQGNIMYTASFQGGKTIDRTFDFGTPIDKTIDIQFSENGAVKKLPVNLTFKTSVSIGCEANSTGTAKASIGGLLKLNYEGGAKYANPDLKAVPSLNMFSVQSTPLKDIVSVEGIDMGNGAPTFFAAQADVQGTASCWVRPNLEVNAFKFIGVAAGLKTSVDAQVGANARASQAGLTVPASAELDWVITPKAQLEVWGTAGIGTQAVVKTDPFKIGEWKFEKSFAGKKTGEITFDPTKM